jgi:putative aminopeptidase FrvX
MNPRFLCELAGRLMQHPAAPYHEHAVRDEVQKICEEHSLPFELDRYGNLLVRLQTSRRERPFVMAAHMDHPGFEIVPAKRNSSHFVRFQGGVPDHYFRAGIKIRLMPGSIPAKLGKRVGKDRTFEVQVSRPLGSLSFRKVGRGRQAQLGLPTAPSPGFAVWELEDFRASDLIVGRACDDLIGVTSILATMIELKKARAPVNVIGVISRAEEIGFRGVLALTNTKHLPRNSLVISLETSRELPGVKMGEGVILRVGDRTSVFNSDAMRFLSEVAAELGTRRKDFKFQRGLMAGGTCEATAFQEFGFQTGAVCIALGNYHNCSPNDKIAAEYVNVADACGMVDLLVAAAKQMPNFKTLIGKLPKRLREMRREAEMRLIKTA